MASARLSFQLSLFRYFSLFSSIAADAPAAATRHAARRPHRLMPARRWLVHRHAEGFHAARYGFGWRRAYVCPPLLLIRRCSRCPLFIFAAATASVDRRPPSSTFVAMPIFRQRFQALIFAFFFFHAETGLQRDF